MIAGYLFEWGFSLPLVSILRMGSLIGFAMIAMVKASDGDRATEPGLVPALTTKFDHPGLVPGSNG